MNRVSVKVISYLMAGVLLSLAWSLRGQFGHLKGAMIPGMFVGLRVLLRTPASLHENSNRVFLIPALAVLGFSLGGHMSYGRLFEQMLKAQQAVEILLPAIKIFGTGFLWGGLGMSLLGWALQEKPFSRFDFVHLSILIFSWVILLGILNLESWDRTLFTASFISIHLINLIFNKSKNILFFGVFGALGFGLAFLFSGLLLSLGSHGVFGSCPWWQLRDQIIGFLGGIMLELACQRKAKSENQTVPGPTTSGARPKQVLGLMALFYGVAIPNAFNVSYHWQAAGGVSKIIWLGTAFISLIYFGSVLMLWKLVKGNEKAVTFTALSLVFYLGFLAIAKETVVYGWQRWEPGFTLIVIYAFLLSFLGLKRLKA
ncbi:MAG: hypothetical protein HYZ85_05020 [Candidatus Omnitrophica bacterium]|nr:hypothetical protein [Candidatus Omnitrophota bacterium]